MGSLAVYCHNTVSSQRCSQRWDRYKYSTAVPSAGSLSNEAAGYICLSPRASSGILARGYEVSAMLTALARPVNYHGDQISLGMVQSGQGNHRLELQPSRSIYVLWVPLLASNSIYEGLFHARYYCTPWKAIKDKARGRASKGELPVGYFATGMAKQQSCETGLVYMACYWPALPACTSAMRRG